MYSMDDLVKAAETSHARRAKPTRIGILGKIVRWIASILPVTAAERAK